jgi:hypothetical protein
MFAILSYTNLGDFWQKKELSFDSSGGQAK